MSKFENRPERWLPKGPVLENDAEPETEFSDLKRGRSDGPQLELNLDTGKFSKEILRTEEILRRATKVTAERSDGSTASYYQLPEGAKELQDLISFRNMNAQVGEMFRALYRYGMSSHSDKLRDAKKVLFYAKAEIERLKKYES